KGMTARTRAHFMNGILGYLASPLWLLLIVLSLLLLGRDARVDSVAAVQLLSLTAVLLFLPKALCVYDLLATPKRRELFGGLAQAAAGAFVETGFSALIAPINMMFHTQFVLWNLMGKKVGWASQNRAASGTSWGEAWRTHRSHVLVGFVLGLLAVFAAGSSGLVLISPLLVGLLGSPFLSVWTSRSGRLPFGLLRTPEETARPMLLESVVNAPSGKVGGSALVRVVCDPKRCASHLALLPGGGPASAKVVGEYGRRLVEEGPDALANDDWIALLSCPEALKQVHECLWSEEVSRLAVSWQAMREELVGGEVEEAV
ncbi:MAG: hypothetical protein ACQKBU_05300, partial [Verrucomicrobiales bacterium]